MEAEQTTKETKVEIDTETYQKLTNLYYYHLFNKELCRTQPETFSKLDISMN